MYNATAQLLQPQSLRSGTGGLSRDHGEDQAADVRCSMVAATATQKLTALGSVSPDCCNCRLRTDLKPRAGWRVRVLLDGTAEDAITYTVVSASKGFGHWHLFLQREA